MWCRPVLSIRRRRTSEDSSACHLAQLAHLDFWLRLWSGRETEARLSPTLLVAAYDICQKQRFCQYWQHRPCWVSVTTSKLAAATWLREPFTGRGQQWSSNTINNQCFHEDWLIWGHNCGEPEWSWDVKEDGRYDTATKSAVCMGHTPANP